MDYSLGIDIGGTRIKAVAVSNLGAMLDWHSLETGADWQQSVRDCAAQIRSTLRVPPVRIGVAAPGLAARDARSIAFMPGRLPGLEGLNWTEFFESSSPVAVFNDAHAALLGEQACGAASGLSDVIMLTLGTGVGGAILSNGKLLKGHLGRAGHLGHISLNPDGARDIVNTPGSLEDAIGECTLNARTNGRFATTQQLLAAVESGDDNAREIWSRSLRALAASLAGLINVLDPEAIILGGGIANSGSALFNPLAKLLDDFEWRPAGRQVKIIPAQLGEKAGALGAAHQAFAGSSKTFKEFFDY